MSHYTVGYHNANQEHYEICEYATDAYEAIQNSKEDVPGLRAVSYTHLTLPTTPYV